MGLKIRSLREFAGVPKGTTGIAEIDPTSNGLYKITWDKLETMRGIPFKNRPLEDWFNQSDFNDYLEKI